MLLKVNTLRMSNFFAKNEPSVFSDMMRTASFNAVKPGKEWNFFVTPKRRRRESHPTRLGDG
jgi:hypothetical protein